MMKLYTSGGAMVHLNQNNYYCFTESLQKLQYPQLFSSSVPTVHDWIIRNLEGQETGPVVFIPNVCNNIQNVVSVSNRFNSFNRCWYGMFSLQICCSERDIEINTQNLDDLNAMASYEI